MGFPGGVVVKNPPVHAGDVKYIGLIPGSGIWLGGAHSNFLQYSCLEKIMERGAGQTLKSHT